MISDYYSVLNVGRDASDEDVRKAYRKRVRELHPDVNPGPNAAAQFAELSDAYEVLRNPQQRAAFDRLSEPAAPTTEESKSTSIFDKIANAADAVLQGVPFELTEEEKSAQHLDNMRNAMAQFYELAVAQDTCRAYLLAAVYAEPARSASMEAVTHLYLEHEDAQAIAVAATPNDASITALHAVTAAIIAGAAVQFVDEGQLTTDPPLGTVDYSTQTIKEVAATRLAETFPACGINYTNK